LQKRRSTRIVIGLILMLPAVEFDHHFFIEAGKIGDVRTDRMLRRNVRP
jgi:hypothetical protein